MKSKRVNYKEPPNLRIHKSRKPKIKVVAEVPSESQPTIYSTWRNDSRVIEFQENVPGGETEWYPYAVLQFVKYNKQSGIKTNIKTKTEEGETIILQSEWVEEHYLAALSSVLKKTIIDSNWMSKSKYEQLSLPPSYKPKFNLDETVWLTLREPRIVIEGKIIEVRAHLFPLQLSEQFKFKAKDIQFANVANKWVFTAQLSKSKREWKYISVSDVQLEEIRHLISIGITSKLHSPLLLGIRPRDIDETSAYFGKTNLYLSPDSLLRPCLRSIDLSKKLAVNIVQNIICKTHSLTPKSASILSFAIKKRVTERNCLLYGDPINEGLFDIGLAYILYEHDIAMKSRTNSILIEMNVEDLSIFNVNPVFQNDIKVKKEFIGQIVFAYNRKHSRLMVQKYSVDVEKKGQCQKKHLRNRLRFSKRNRNKNNS
eukprot:46781_1